MAASHENTQPYMTMHETRARFEDMPIARIAPAIENAINTCKYLEAVRRELVGADYNDMIWIFFAIDVLVKHHADLSALHLK